MARPNLTKLLREEARKFDQLRGEDYATLVSNIQNAKKALDEYRSARGEYMTDVFVKVFNKAYKIANLYILSHNKRPLEHTTSLSQLRLFGPSVSPINTTITTYIDAEYSQNHPTGALWVMTLSAKGASFLFGVRSTQMLMRTKSRISMINIPGQPDWHEKVKFLMMSMLDEKSRENNFAMIQSVLNTYNELISNEK